MVLSLALFSQLCTPAPSPPANPSAGHIYNRSAVIAPAAAPLPRPRRPALLGLAAIVLLGMGLRLWAVDAGAPFRMGVDEPVIVTTALRMVRTGDFHPHFFDYGGLTLYLHAAVGALAFMVGAMEGRWNHLDAIWEGDLLVAGRTATALLGTLTIVLVFRIGLRWGVTVALIAALAMAVLPAHVREAHFILTDTPLTLFITLALLLSIRAAEQQRLPALALAGLAVGLATAVKYNGVVALLMPAVVAAMLPPGRRLAGLSATVAASAAAFLVCAPYTVLDLPAFLNGMAFLMQSYNEHRPLSEAMSNYLGYLRNWFTWPGVLPSWVGYVGLLLVAAGFGVMLRRPQARPQRVAAGLVSGFTLVYFWFVSTQSLQYGRYLLPIGPMLAVGLAVGLSALTGRASHRWRRPVLCAGVLLLLMPPTAQAVSWNRTHALTTTVEQAAQWILSQADAGDRIVVEASPVHLPPRFLLTRTTSLIARTTEDYQREGVTYLIANSTQSSRYYADPATHVDNIAAHRTLLALTHPVATFVPDAYHPGPTITILRVPPLAPPDAP
jgi:4-amino-4-deoxy-L-arabinose transferase-like glycosyltransferase